MSKKSKGRRLADNEASAKLNNLRISPQKLNLIATQIRGKHVSEALNILEFSKKRVARDVFKALVSVISNAENNHGLDIDELYVKEATVGKSLVLKRFMTRARGRGVRILKPFSQINIIVHEIKGTA
jgi:large subunit ribosomal protein L22